ncbi:hypothetical protein HC891_21895 [Candidatus Gracilibacteria bacterium]|nr:hypothetical protein [Candidatus Gracilibacteria bacterium]
MNDLYSVPLSGGDAVRLTAPLEDFRVENYDLKGDSTAVVVHTSKRTTGQNELYTIPISGGTPLRLTPLYTETVESELRGKTRLAFTITGDDSQVIFGTDATTVGKSELYSVPTDGGPIVRLSRDYPDPPGFGVGNWGVRSFDVSRDGAYVVYQNSDEFTERLHGTRSDGSAPIDYTVPLSTAESVDNYLISKDSSRLIALTTDGFEIPGRIYSTPLANDIPVVLTEFSYPQRIDQLTSSNNGQLFYRLRNTETTTSTILRVPQMVTRHPPC